jgi:hypothetical protein
VPAVRHWRKSTGQELIVSRRILGTIVCLRTARIDCFSLFFFKVIGALSTSPPKHSLLCLIVQEIAQVMRYIACIGQAKKRKALAIRASAFLFSQTYIQVVPVIPRTSKVALHRQ